VAPGERYFLAQTKQSWCTGDILAATPVKMEYRGSHCFEVRYVYTESNLVYKSMQYSRVITMVGVNKEIRKRFGNKIGRWTP
jgi:hypothetical protein